MAWSFSSNAPVYLQIVSHIRSDILRGVYQPDQQLPAVRQLAQTAGVNPNTMQRAFSILEAEGVIVTRGTIGRFITTDLQVLEKAREALRREVILHILEEAHAAGLTPEELVAGILAQRPPSPDSPDSSL